MSKLPLMSDEVEQDRALRTRFGLTAIVLGVLIVTNAVWGLISTRSRSAEDEALNQQNAEIDSRLTQTKSILDDVKRLRQKTSDLNERAVKIEATLDGSSSNSK